MKADRRFIAMLITVGVLATAILIVGIWVIRSKTNDGVAADVPDQSAPINSENTFPDGGSLIVPTAETFPPTSSDLQPTPVVVFVEPTWTPIPTDIPPLPTPEPPIIFKDYVVQPGDTLYQITQVEVTSIELMATYSIAADHVVAGNVLHLPVGNPAYCFNRGRPYIVREHETAYSIATAFNTTPQQLQASNQLDANFSIRTAQVLCVP